MDFHFYFADDADNVNEMSHGATTKGAALKSQHNVTEETYDVVRHVDRGHSNLGDSQQEGPGLLPGDVTLGTSDDTRETAAEAGDVPGNDTDNIPLADEGGVRDLVEAPCSVNPCKDRGRCVAKGLRYFCECFNRATGTNCESENPCSSFKMLHSLLIISIFR